MSVRVEWVEIRHPFLSARVVERGTEMPDGQAVTSDVALVIETDDLVVVEGSHEQLRGLLLEYLRLVDERGERADVATDTVEGPEVREPIQVSASAPAALLEEPADHSLTPEQIVSDQHRWTLKDAAELDASLRAVMELGLKVWTTDGLQADFKVLSFSAPYVLVRDKTTGQHGSMRFTHRPRYYFGFVPTEVAVP